MSTPRLKLQEEDSGQRQARKLLKHLALALRLVTIHELSNAAMVQPVAQLHETVNDAFQDYEVVRIQNVGENVYLNHDVILLDYSSFESSVMLRKVYERMGIAEVAFSYALSIADLRQFLLLFQTHYRSKEPLLFLKEKLANITVRPIENAQENSHAADWGARENLLRAFARVTVLTDTTLAALVAGRPARLPRLRRAIQNLADASQGQESMLVGLTRFPNQLGDLSFHLTSVAALVLLMVRRLGASRKTLSECCMAALLHDVGRSSGEQGALVAAGIESLLASDVEIARQSMVQICTRNISPQALGYAASAYECTRPAEQAGALGKLLAVPCAFDLLTNPAQGKLRVAPDQTLRILFEQAGSRFDVHIVELFAQTVGLFPVGTTVKLSGGEIAIVVDVPWNAADYDKPRVKVIQDIDGPTDYVMDLADLGGRVRILSTIDAVDAGINVPHFLLG